MLIQSNLYKHGLLTGYANTGYGLWWVLVPVKISPMTMQQYNPLKSR